MTVIWQLITTALLFFFQIFCKTNEIMDNNKN